MSVPAAAAELGRMAVADGLITLEQLDSALEVVRGPRGGQVEDVLVALGHLGPEQLRALRLRLLERNPGRFAPRRDQLVARKAVARGLVPQAAADDALRAIGLRLAEGDAAAPPVGEYLWQQGQLTRPQLETLTEQQIQVMYCPACPQHYDVFGYHEGYRIKCLTCQTVLVPPPDDAPPTEHQPMHFDQDRADELLVFGRYMLRNELCSKEQLNEALALQARKRPESHLGDLLVELGHLPPEALAGLRQEERRVEEEERRKLVEACRGQKLGRIAVKQGFVAKVMLKKAVDKQERLAERNAGRRVGEYLIEAGQLTPYQLLKLLEWQGKALVRCTGCNQQYNAPFDLPPQFCPECGQELRRLDAPAQVGAVREIDADVSGGHPVAGAAERRDALEESAEIEALPAFQELTIGESQAVEKLIQDAEPAPAEDLGKQLAEAGNKLKEIYAQLGAKEEERRAKRRPDTRPTRLIDLGQVQQRSGVATPYRPGGARPAEPAVPAGWKVWLVRLVVGALLIGSGAALPLLTRPPAQPRPADAGQAAPELFGAELAAAVRPGDPVTIWGHVPFGAENLALSPEVQGFYLETPDGQAWWAVDESGASFMPLQARTLPENKDRPFLLMIEAEVVAPGSVPVAPTRPERTLLGTLRVVRWEKVHALPDASTYLMRRSAPAEPPAGG